MPEKKAKKTGVVKTKPKASKAKEKLNSGAFAVIKTGGKQYKIFVGSKIKVEKILGNYKEGSNVTFDKVLLLDNGNELQIGNPLVSGAEVVGTVKKIGRYPKVTVIKYKQKSRYYKKNGHRQPFFEVLIDSIK